MSEQQWVIDASAKVVPCRVVGPDDFWVAYLAVDVLYEGRVVRLRVPASWVFPSKEEAEQALSWVIFPSKEEAEQALSWVDAHGKSKSKSMPCRVVGPYSDHLDVEVLNGACVTSLRVPADWVFASREEALAWLRLVG